ncbi:MAG: hypothetical protein AAGG38_06975 [Planctomycetota bacterium]
MPTPPTPTADCQINWLELARFAAAGQGHTDLARGVRRLATLAAAVHRGQLCSGPTPRPEPAHLAPPRVHGRTPQATPPRAAHVTEDAR